MSEANDIDASVSRAEDDYEVARSALRRKNPLIYPVCFHAQQCAEKYLKAILDLREIDFPKTHDLLMLSSLCEENGIFLPISARDLDTLNHYSVLVRYPGQQPTLEDARDAFLISGNVRRYVRRHLGIKK